MKNFIQALFIVFLMVSCGEGKVDTKEVKKEMDKYKIKKILPGEILAKGEEIGAHVIDSAQSIINKRLDSSLAKGNLEKALFFCKLSNNPEIEALEKTYQAKLYRAGFLDRLRNPENAPDSNQSLILEGYDYALKHGMPLKNDVFEQKSQIIVNKPILMTETCLPCHGKIYQDITEDNYKVITQKYPTDKSTGFKINEPMGVWTIILDKTFVIQNMNSENR